MSRHDTVFSLRYATVVLERHAALWGFIGACCRVASLLAGSAAIAALGAQNPAVALIFGIVFAFAQAIEYATHPADKAAAARVQARQYARVWAHESDYTDADLAMAYRKVIVDDDIKPSASLKDLAYNQVLSEMDCDPAAAYPEGRWHRFVALIA